MTTRLKHNDKCLQMWFMLNPFPHVDAFWRLCSKQLFENIVIKEEIAQKKQFLLLPECFPLLVIGYHLIIEIFYFLTKYVKSHLLQNCPMRERVKQMCIKKLDKILSKLNIEELHHLPQRFHLKFTVADVSASG